LTDIDAYLMPIPVQELSGTEHYLPILGGFPQVFEPDQRFAYNNSGYVVLALIAERVTGTPVEQLVMARVCTPAELVATSFLRSDELSGDVAIGYLSGGGLRTNVLHLPVLGSGDGGMFSTAADMRRFWTALHGGRIVSDEAVQLMTSARSEAPENEARYGHGFWLAPSGPVMWLEGFDAGVSFRSVHDPTRDLTHTVLSNTSSGAWPMTKLLDRLLDVTPTA
jgi:CubicO group peptidase (beta-lactamase class C family)